MARKKIDVDAPHLDIHDLSSATGTGARTIRRYVSLGLVAHPTGFGLAARYTERDRLKLLAIASLRARGLGLDDIGGELAKLSLKGLRAFAPKEPEPSREIADASASAPEATASASAPEATAPAATPASDAAAARPAELTGLADLPAGARWIIAPLLPGLALMVREDTSPLARRVAQEIAERYGSRDV